MDRKKIFLEPLWKLRREFRYLVENPPEGYEFLCKSSFDQGLAQRLSRFNLSYTAINELGKVFPVHLAKAWAGKFRRPPKGTDLTYAVSHPVFRREPWVMDMRAEQPHVMVGGERPFGWCKRVLRGLFSSPYCRRVIYEVEAGKRAFLQGLHAPELEQKVVVVPSGVPLRNFTKAFNDDKVKLLFVNSANINASWNFELKGGRVLLDAFLRLRRDYKNLELFIRSEMPRELKRDLQGLVGLTIVDEPLPWEQLEREFKTADIFVMPTYVTPSIVFLDAMSYELPIVTTDIWANPELVRDGENGLLVPNPLAGRYTEGFIVHFDSSAFRKAMATVDPVMVEALVAKLRLLIEDPGLRRRLGRRGRHIVEEMHSLQKQRERLRKVLDEALEDAESLGSPSKVDSR